MDQNASDWPVTKQSTPWIVLAKCKMMGVAMIVNSARFELQVLTWILLPFSILLYVVSCGSQ